MPPRAVNTGGVAKEFSPPMREPPYSELTRQQEITDAIRAASDESFASDVPVVYFIQAGDTGPIKIGYCQKYAGVRKRINELQTGCPWPLMIRRVARASRGIYSEKHLHEHFVGHRLCGEWFEATPEIASAANVKPSPSALRRLLQDAFQRGYDCGRETEHADFVIRVCKEMRATIDTWQDDYAGGRTGDWEREKQDAIEAILNRNAA